MEEAGGRFSVSCQFKNAADNFERALSGAYGPDVDRN